MRKKLIILIMAALAAASCRDREPEEPGGPKGALSVNGRASDSAVSVSSEGGIIDVYISCDVAWQYTLSEDSMDWISPGERIDKGKGNWIVPLGISPSDCPESREGSVSFTCQDISVTLTLVQGSPDPVALVKTPGFYGVDGQDIVVAGNIQCSSFHGAGSWQFRLIDHDSMTVWAIGDIPENVSAGNILSVRGKTIQRGMTVDARVFPLLSVVRSTPQMVWLKKDDGTYFVLER